MTVSDRAVSGSDVDEKPKAHTHQQTGSRSTMSLGQTVSGALLSMETTPVGVGLGVLPVQDEDGTSGPSSSSCPEPVSSGSECVKFKEGQHSGLSSEQPMRGT